MPDIFDNINRIARQVAERAYGRLITPFPADIVLGQDDIVHGDVENCLVQGKVPIFDSFGNFIACNERTRVAPGRPKVKATPKVSAPPSQVYSPPPPIYVPEPEPTRPSLPTLPPRRLPRTASRSEALPTGGGTRPSIPSKTMTVKTSVKNGFYGCLLHEPILKTPVKLNVCVNTGYKEHFKDTQYLAAAKFLLYMLDKLNIPLPEPPTTPPGPITIPAGSTEAGSPPLNPSDLQPLTLRDGGLTIISRKRYAVATPPSGGVVTVASTTAASNPASTAIIFGCDGIAEFINDYLTRSNLSLLNIGGLVPLDYELVSCPAYHPAESNPSDGFQPHNIQEQANETVIKKIYDVLGGDKWYIDSETPLIETDGESLLKNIITMVYPLDEREKAEIEYQLSETARTRLDPTIINPYSLNTFRITNLIEFLSVLGANQFYRGGLHEFPVTVPNSLVTPGDPNITPEEREAAEEAAITQVPSFSKLFGWFIERFDEVVGQFEIAIKIQDTDLEAEGEQTEIIKLPNIAESIAEAFGLLVKISNETEVLVTLCVKQLVEAGQDKQQNFKSYMLLKAATDYLAFNYEEKTHEMPMQFTPGKEELSDILQPSKVKVIATEYKDKDNFQKILFKLLEMASIIKSVHWRKIESGEDTISQVRALMESLKEMKKRMAEGKVDGEGRDDFGRFTEEAERGFIDTPGITDSTRPYGEDLEIRPRIRTIGSPE